MFAARASNGGVVYNASTRAQTAANQLVRLIDDNNLTVYLSSEGNLSMSVPDNLTLEEGEVIRARLAELDTNLSNSIDRMTDAVNITASVETDLLGRGIVLNPRDFTNPIRLAREAYERFKNKLIIEENDEQPEQ